MKLLSLLAIVGLLAAHAFAAVITISPSADAQAAINGSGPGDRIVFAGPTAPPRVLTLLSGREYAGPGPLIGNGLQTAGADHVAIHDLGFQQINGDAILLQATDSSIERCKFSNVAGTAINAPPWSVFARNSIRGNSFDGCGEGIHLNFQRSGADCSVSFNTLSHVHRHGIELQSTAQNLTVEGNRLSDWSDQFPSHTDHDGHIAISCATGAESWGDAHGVRVVNNVILGTGFRDVIPDYHYAAIEIMGAGSVVSGNYLNNWGIGVLHGQDHGLTVAGNVFAGVGVTLAAEAGQYPAGPPADVTTGNRFGPIGFVPIPPTPGGPATAPATAPATPSPAIATGRASARGVLTWSFSGPAGASYSYLVQPTHGGPVLARGTLPAGSTSVSAAGVPDQWQEDLVLTAILDAVPSGPVTATAQYRDADVPDAPPASRPAATLLHTIRVWSDGSFTAD